MNEPTGGPTEPHEPAHEHEAARKHEHQHAHEHEHSVHTTMLWRRGVFSSATMCSPWRPA